MGFKLPEQSHTSYEVSTLPPSHHVWFIFSLLSQLSLFAGFLKFCFSFNKLFHSSFLSFFSPCLFTFFLPSFLFVAFFTSYLSSCIYKSYFFRSFIYIFLVCVSFLDLLLFFLPVRDDVNSGFWDWEENALGSDAVGT